MKSSCRSELIVGLNCLPLPVQCRFWVPLQVGTIYSRQGAVGSSCHSKLSIKCVATGSASDQTVIPSSGSNDQSLLVRLSGCNHRVRIEFKVPRRVQRRNKLSPRCLHRIKLPATTSSASLQDATADSALDPVVITDVPMSRPVTKSINSNYHGKSSAESSCCHRFIVGSCCPHRFLVTTTAVASSAPT